jgi:hypothetical protein
VDGRLLKYMHEGSTILLTLLRLKAVDASEMGEEIREDKRRRVATICMLPSKNVHMVP